MTSIAGTRRSPRTVERLCNGLEIPGLNLEQAATLLSLAECTGWSADRIAHKLAEFTEVKMIAEKIWDYHWIWVGSRDFEEISIQEKGLMIVLMKAIGVDLTTTGRPLSQTIRPNTVRFTTMWNPRDPNGQPLFSGFTSFARLHTKAYLAAQRSPSIYGKLTPVEEDLFYRFGRGVTTIVEHVLKRWARAMFNRLRREPELRPLQEQKHVNLIIEYLKLFQQSYESKFGKMEERKPASELAHNAQSILHIQSTGYGTKVFLGMIMADRLHVIEKQRRDRREKIGFAEVAVSDLERDAKHCPICQDLMGVERIDGNRETPIRMVICCGQVIGDTCLKTWLSQIFDEEFRDTCPTCRFQFPDTFLDKLFPPPEGEAQLADDKDDMDLDGMDLTGANPSSLGRFVPHTSTGYGDDSDEEGEEGEDENEDSDEVEEGEGEDEYLSVVSPLWLSSPRTTMLHDTEIPQALFEQRVRDAERHRERVANGEVMDED